MTVSVYSVPFRNNVSLGRGRVREKVPSPEKDPLPYVTDFEGSNASSIVYDEPI